VFSKRIVKDYHLGRRFEREKVEESPLYRLRKEVYRIQEKREGNKDSEKKEDYPGKKRKGGNRTHAF